MTCDPGRPCNRCIQRKLALTCQDAPRKRKKYLVDVPTQALDTYPPPLNTAPSSSAEPAPHYPPMEMSAAPLQRNTNFMSTAADMEYLTLSNLLQDINSTDLTPQSPAMSPQTMAHNNGFHIPAYSAKVAPLPAPSLPRTAPTAKPAVYDQKYFKCDELINQYFLGETRNDAGVADNFPDVITAIKAMAALDPAALAARSAKLALLFAIGNSADDPDAFYKNQIYKEPEEIYEKVRTPFSYTPGYHLLIAYLRKRFNKPMLVKMAELMATYRPLFIACTNLLKEGDLIFMEQCFQRTLLTYDAFIRVNGTPTIVWRRTGEIAYVGHEFCILTGWSREQLLGKHQRKFIVELLDDKSVVEYFQLFLRIAFGDFLGATMTECTLLTPNPDVKIRTGCIWTLKRDVFGIPMMIVGNFLPIL